MLCFCCYSILYQYFDALFYKPFSGIFCIYYIQKDHSLAFTYSPLYHQSHQTGLVGFLPLRSVWRLVWSNWAYLHKSAWLFCLYMFGIARESILLCWSYWCFKQELGRMCLKSFPTLLNLNGRELIIYCGLVSTHIT